MFKKIFVNLPVKDLSKSIKFFKELGFGFNPKFTDENAGCMIIEENIFAMLLVEKFFKNFVKDDISDAKKSTEVLIAVSFDKREKVDKIVNLAVKLGGIEYRGAQDHKWMYGRSFQDLDGHVWEIFHMDESKMPKSG